MILITSNISIALANDESNKAINDDIAKLTLLDAYSKLGIKDVSLRLADGRPNGGNKVLVLAYSSEAFDQKKTSTEIANILGPFLGTVEAGWDCEELWVVVGDITGKVALANWYCSKEWTEAYVRGDMTSKQMASNVVGTVSVI